MLVYFSEDTSHPQQLKVNITKLPSLSTSSAALLEIIPNGNWPTVRINVVRLTAELIRRLELAPIYCTISVRYPRGPFMLVFFQYFHVLRCLS